MNALQRLAYTASRRLGYRIVPEWRWPRAAQAEYLDQLFRWLRIDLVLDVGANRGQFRDFLRHEVGYTGEIISWEPIPELAARLEPRARADGSWRIESSALGRESRTCTLHVTSDTEFSSLHEPSSEARARFEAKTAFRDVEVPMRRLDDELARRAGALDDRRVYLKLDTQGHDLEVLAGAPRALERIDALQSELAVRPLYEGVPGLAEASRSIEEMQYLPSAVFPNNPGHFPWLLEVDMHFVARRHMPLPKASTYP